MVSLLAEVLISPLVPTTLSVPLHKPTLGVPVLLLPSIFMVSDLSCATFTASVNSLPAATLTIWRLMSLSPAPPPTETAPISLLSTLFVDLKPLATVLGPVVTE